MADEQRQMSVVRGTPKRSPEFSEVLAKELAVTAEVFQATLTELMMVGYSEALSGMTPKGLAMGFRRARRTLKFFPKPAEIRELAEAEAESCKTYYQGLPALPPLTEEEKAAEAEIFKGLCKQFGWKESR